VPQHSYTVAGVMAPAFFGAEVGESPDFYMPLGARQGDIFLLVLGQGMRLTVAGLVLGIVAALGAASLLAGLLFGVKQTDPLSFLGVSLILLTAAVLACYVPARRAMSVDPVVALRDE
jgi:ABC-type antimicrobial peptide transport system permease subunit